MAYDNNEWRHLNAYADGELPEHEARRFEQRLVENSELQRDLEQLRDLKRGIALMYPTPAEPRQRSPLLHARKTRMAAVVAATVAAIGVLSAVAVAMFPDRTTWLEHASAMHAEQSKGAYLVEERYVAQTVSTGHALEFRPPDLTSSRLYLVDIRTSRWDDREAISLHYRGLRGCRLTIVAIETSDTGDPMPAAAASDETIRTWLYDGFAFAMIANGMDPDRFDSVANYAKAVIVEPSADDRQLRVAMDESRQNARPCA